MGIREKIQTLLRGIFHKGEYPVHAACSICGEKTYLPFTCPYCGRYFCGNHHLPFNHDCKNIDEWKGHRSSSGKK